MQRYKQPCACKYHNEIQTQRCDPENPYVSIRKLVTLMEDPITADFIDRQTIILNDFLYACSCAFWVRDLPYVIRLVELIIENPVRMSIYRKQLEVILKVSAVPPMMVCTSEVLTCKKNVEEYFTFLGCLLARINETHLRELILQALWCLLQKKTPRGICCITLNMTQAGLETGCLAELCAQLAEIADEDLYTKMLKLMICMAEMSPIICHKLIGSGVLDFVMLRMDPSWKERREVPSSFPSATDPIWNFEHSVKLLDLVLDSIRVCPGQLDYNNIRTPCLASLRAFQYAFRIKCQRKGSELDRNTMMIVLLKLLSFFPYLQYVQSQLVDDVALLSIATESEAGDSWVNPKLKFTNSNVDYQFKKMLIFAVCYIVDNFSSLKILREKKVMYYFLQVVTPGVRCIWIPEQHCKLAILTLHSLQTIVPHLFDEFVQYKGIIKLLSMIDIYIMDTYNKELLLACLKTIHFILNLNKQEIFDDLYNTNTSDTFLVFSNEILSQKILTLLDQECLSYCFCILQILYKQFPATDKPGTLFCCTYMTKLLLRNNEGPPHDPRTIICGLDCLWETLCANDDNINFFVSRKGIYLLLDIIQKYTFPVKMVGLRVLVDLCEDIKCIPYLVTWRGNGQNLEAMLMEIFRIENIKMHIKSTNKGIISDIEVPLMGIQQRCETFGAKKDPNSSPATVDLLASCRPKVYALLHLLNVRHKEHATIANDHYKLNHHLLSIEDQITMVLAENFLALKLGEVWTELAQDFETTGFRPIPIDGDLISTLTQRFYKWALHTKEAQVKLLKKDKQKERSEERLLYHTLNESKLDFALLAMQQLDYLARTTERMFRWSHKMIQNKQIDESLKFTVENAHRTFLHKSGVTRLFGHTVNIQSNKIINPHEKKFDIKPVSPCTSEENAPVYSTSSEESERSFSRK